MHLAGAGKMALERRLSADSAGRSVEAGTASERLSPPREVSGNAISAWSNFGLWFSLTRIVVKAVETHLTSLSPICITTFSVISGCTERHNSSMDGF
jgi:hypothetical protein